MVPDRAELAAVEERIKTGYARWEELEEKRKAAEAAAIEAYGDKVVTGKVVPGEHRRCVEAGANDYVPKPVDTAELLAALRPWMSKSVQSTMS